MRASTRDGGKSLATRFAQSGWPDRSRTSVVSRASLHRACFHDVEAAIAQQHRRAPCQAADLRSVQHLNAHANAVRCADLRRRRRHDAPRPTGSHRHRRCQGRGDDHHQPTTHNSATSSTERVPERDGLGKKGCNPRAATYSSSRAERPAETRRRNRAAPARRETRDRAARSCAPARENPPCTARVPVRSQSSYPTV